MEDYTGRVKVEIGGTDFTHWVSSVSVDAGDVTTVGTDGAGVDAVVRTATLELFQAYGTGEEIDGPAPMEEVVISVDRTEPGEAADWTVVFEGYTGDDVSFEDPIVRCELRDKAKVLQNAFIVEERIYPKDPETIEGMLGQEAWVVIQDILDDELGADEVVLFTESGTAIEPIVPGDFSDVPVVAHVEDEPWGIGHESVWDAIQVVAGQFGFFLGYRWNGSTEQFELTLLEPDIDKDVADHALDWTDEMYVHQLDLSDRDIRNWVRVGYVDASGEEQEVVRYDQDSIDTYGLKRMEIMYAETPLIWTEAQAERMAELALHDLSSLHAVNRIDIPLEPDMDLFDGLAVTDPRSLEGAVFFAVNSLRHTFTFGEDPTAKTEVICASNVICGHLRWLDMDQRPPDPRVEVPSPHVTNLDVSPIGVALGDGSFVPAILATWDKPNSSTYREAKVYRRKVIDPGVETGEWVLEREESGSVAQVWPVSEGQHEVAVVAVNKAGQPSSFEGAPKDTVTVPGKETGPSVVQIRDSEFIRDIRVSWYAVSDSDFLAYEVRTDENFGIDDEHMLYRGDAVQIRISDPEEREYTFYIRAVNRSGLYSPESADVTVTNPVPAAPAPPSVTEFFNSFWIVIDPLVDATIVGYYLYVQEIDDEDEPIGDEVQIDVERLQRTTYQASPGRRFEVQVSAYDVIGEGPRSSPAVVAETRKVDDIAEFAQELIPPKLVDDLPSLPDEEYPEGALVVWTEDKKLYRNYDDVWAKYVDELPDLPDEDYPVGTVVIVIDDAEVYENEADSWVFQEAVEPLTVFQNIVAATVVAGAISAKEIAADAIIADHIGANEIIANSANIAEAIIETIHVNEIAGNKIVGSLLRSVNWGTDAGSEFNLDDGTFKMGGSEDPKLEWDGADLTVRGKIFADEIVIPVRSV